MLTESFRVGHSAITIHIHDKTDRTAGARTHTISCDLVNNAIKKQRRRDEHITQHQIKKTKNGTKQINFGQ